MSLPHRFLPPKFETPGVVAAGPGLVTHRSARIWLRCREAGHHRIELWSEQGFAHTVEWNVALESKGDGTTSVLIPDDFEGAPDLPAAETIRYRVSDSKGSSGEGRFMTAPAPGQDHDAEFSIAFLSCHQPLVEEGKIHPESRVALERLTGVLEEHRVARVLCLGDQMYADHPADASLFEEEYFRSVAPPGAKSLFDCSADQVRALYQERFRHSFALDGFKTMITNWATTMICDDHEIRDNFGSDPVHSTPRWQHIRQGALEAIFDYEGLRQQPPSSTRPRSMHFSWEYGPVATFVMDLRSERRVDDEKLVFFSEAQLDDLRQYLSEQADKSILVLGLSIPLAFAPEELVAAGIKINGEGGDSAERWWNEKAEESRKALLSVLDHHLSQNPAQILVMVGGDVHAGSVSHVRFRGAPAYQLISSALSNRQDFLSRTVAEKLPELGPWQNGEVSWDLMQNALGDGSNPYTGLNLGLLSVRPRPGRTPEVKLRIVGLSEDEGPVVMFESKPLELTAQQTPPEAS